MGLNCNCCEFYWNRLNWKKSFKIKNKSPILVLTKGLKLDGRNLISMSSLLKKYNKNLNISVLKGPCLAKELAKKVKSFTVVANKNINTAKKLEN